MILYNLFMSWRVIVIDIKICNLLKEEWPY